MKKLALHIKPLAIFLVFLLAFAISGKSLHLAFSDCDHQISLLGGDHHEDGMSWSAEADINDCELCKFTIHPPLLVHTPSIEFTLAPTQTTIKGSIADQFNLQSFLRSTSLRGPPSIS